MSGGGITLLSPNSTTTGTGRNDPESLLLEARARATVGLRISFSLRGRCATSVVRRLSDLVLGVLLELISSNCLSKPFGLDVYKSITFYISVKHFF